MIGVVLGVAGTFAPSGSWRELAWGVDGTALIVACALLALDHFRRGDDSFRFCNDARGQRHSVILRHPPCKRTQLLHQLRRRMTRFLLCRRAWGTATSEEGQQLFPIGQYLAQMSPVHSVFRNKGHAAEGCPNLDQIFPPTQPE